MVKNFYISFNDIVWTKQKTQGVEWLSAFLS